MASMAQFLPYSSARRLVQLNEVDERYKKRARRWLIFCALTEPLRWYERMRWGATLRRTEIKEAPLFLLGFGRSGTTHLHNLMWQDPQFGGVTNYQASLHSIALMGQSWLPKLFAGQMPKTRPMDNVAISLEGPQEEEMAMMNATHHAPLHVMSFPRGAPEIYDRYVADLGKDLEATGGWKKAYVEVLKKATLLTGGKRLVLKTPPNTGRIDVLLDMFPDARFVNIVRNPYPVYQSMRNMYRKTLPGAVLQQIDWQQIDAWIVQAYQSQMQKYLAQRSLIPDRHLVEIKYEELEAHPLETLEDIYEKLNLGDFEVQRPRLVSYLESLGEYKKNHFEFPSDIVETVNRSWGFAFDAFGYKRQV
ncbi:MAG: hypothetical protein CL917_19295 [Deltaproteobacteria bacterium]|nr:hypothetical protein [Deltaproteobacteria bacterium]